MKDCHFRPNADDHCHARQRRKHVAAIIFAAALVSGSPALAQPFPPNAPGSDRTVSWYEDHTDEMHRVNAACREDPGQAVNNPNCIDANTARFSASLDAAIAKADAAIRKKEQPLHPGR